MGLAAPGFSNGFEPALKAAAVPKRLAKNWFRDGRWVTGTGGGRRKSLPKQGTGVSLVNQNLG
jgi:hypothetical protein